MHFPWTRIEGTELWKAAAANYRANGLAYHNLDHVRQLYSHADAMGMAYDLSLDRAILAHDVVLNGSDKDEEMSAAWLDRWLEEEDPLAVQLIMTTADHRPGHPDARLALLDLADFMRPEQRRVNTRKLRDEAARRKGTSFDQTDWVRGSLAYLGALNGRIQADLPALGGENLRLWSRISHGIACTMTTTPLVYAPHPAQGIRRFTRDGEVVLRAVVAAGQSNDERMGDIIPDPVKDEDRLGKILVGLEEQGMVHRASTARGEPRNYAPTDEARDWVARMDAPGEDWPEPEFP